jgi:hypothetical protein
MKEKFWCASCKKIFEAKGEKKEWNDPIYGPCMKFIATCPTCKTECGEYRDPNAVTKKESMPAMSCGGGNCSHCEYAN